MFRLSGEGNGKANPGGANPGSRGQAVGRRLFEIKLNTISP